MRRLPLALALLGALVAAGCATPTPTDESPDTNNATPGGGPQDNPPQDDEPEEVQDVPYRVLAVGTTSAMGFPVRLVFTDQAEWETFWREHQKESFEGGSGQPNEPPPAPQVDFETERAVAITLGDQPDTCRHVRVTNATTDGQVTTLTVTTYGPGPDMGCGAMITQPYVMVAIPADGTEVAYRDEEKRDPLPQDRQGG